MMGLMVWVEVEVVDKDSLVRGGMGGMKWV